MSDRSTDNNSWGDDGDDARPASMVSEGEASKIRAALVAAQHDVIEREEPPASVWAGISAAINADHRDAADSTAAASPDPVIDLGAERAKRRGATLLAAAAVVVLFVGSALALITATSGPDVITRSALDPLDGQTAMGEVRVVETDDGLELDLEYDGVETGTGYLELWVIDVNVDAMVSLGPVRGDGRYLVPAGVELATYPIVDLSIEQPDGDPTHGGKSVLRGILDV